MRTCFVLGLCLLSGGAASAAPPVFTVDILRVADTLTPLPNDPELNYSAFAESSIIMTERGLSYVNINIGAFNNPSINGLYQSSPGGIATIAASGSSPFENGGLFDQVYSRNTTIVFRARTNSIDGPQSSIWIDDGNELSNLIPIGVELPDGAGPAINMAYPRVSGDDVLFVGVDASPQLRIYRTSAGGGPLTTVIDENTLPRFKAEGVGFDLGDFQGDQFVFRTLSGGAGPGNGVYAGDLDGNVVEFAIIGDPVPGREGEEFFRFSGETGHPSMDNGQVAFVGQGLNGSQGVYTTTITDNTLEVVVDDTMTLPNDNGTTIAFGSPSISGDNISFIGIGSGGQGNAMFVSMAGTIVDVIHVGDTLDGKIVGNVLSGSFALYDNQVAFTVIFTDFSRGLYLATVIPTPGGVMVMALGGVWAVRRRRGALNA